MAKQGFTVADIEGMYGRHTATRGQGVASAEPEMDPGETVRLPTGRTEEIWNHHDPQFASDSHAGNYDNDTPDDWRRGGGDGLSDATGKPFFDHSPPRNKMRR
jgi:hypothetical protein